MDTRQKIMDVLTGKVHGSVERIRTNWILKDGDRMTVTGTVRQMFQEGLVEADKDGVLKLREGK